MPMKSISLSELRVGDCFDRSLFLAGGQKIVPAGTKLTERHLDMLMRQSSSVLYLAESADELSSGQTPGGGGGSRDRSSRGGATEANDPNVARLRKQRMDQAEQAAQRMADLAQSCNLRIAPEEMEVWDVHREPPAPWPDEQELRTFREALVDQLRELHRRVDQGDSTDIADFAAIVDALWRKLIDHRERFTQLALLVPRRDDYLPDHAMCVAVLAMATGAQLTWSEVDVRVAGLVGLTCDLGMLMVPARIRSGGEQLTDIDRGRVQRHTAYSVAMCDAINGLPEPVKLAAYQHHERENGSGYPNHLREGDIHDLARVVAVADVFAALTSPRHYRQNKLPYTAMEQMVRFAAASQFDKPATRALVQAAGLFPVGSFVKLSNDHIAQVVAANANHLDRPIIRLIDDDGQPADKAIDLSGVPAKQIKVQRPVEGPHASAA